MFAVAALGLSASVLFPLQYLGISIVAIGVAMLGKMLWQKSASEKQAKTIIADVASS
jgi:hypothetical protein